MNCTQCGQQVSETTRFCPSCGTPVGATPVSSAPVSSAPISSTPVRGTRIGGAPSKPESRGKLVAILGGVGLLLIIAAGVWYIKRPQPGSSTVALQTTQPTGGDPGKATPAQISGFDWSGLSPEQLQSARAALDEAIAKEERARASSSNAAPADAKSTP